MPEPVFITDDELVALAVAHGSAWPGGLPTVDVESEEQLGAAAFRGNRSLVVRDLGPGDVGRTALDGLAATLFAASRSIAVYLGSERFERASWAFASMHIPSEAGWLLTTTSPLGVHKLAVAPVEDHRAYLETVIGAAIVEGPTEASDERAPAWLCVATLASDRTNGLLAAARRNEVVVGDVDYVSGKPEIVSALSECSVTTAMGKVFDAISA